MSNERKNVIKLLSIRWDRVILTYLIGMLVCGVGALITLTVIAAPIFAVGFAAGVVSWYLLRFLRRHTPQIESMFGTCLR